MIIIKTINTDRRTRSEPNQRFREKADIDAARITKGYAFGRDPEGQIGGLLCTACGQIKPDNGHDEWYGWKREETPPNKNGLRRCSECDREGVVRGTWIIRLRDQENNNWYDNSRYKLGLSKPIFTYEPLSQQPIPTARRHVFEKSIAEEPYYIHVYIYNI